MYQCFGALGRQRRLITDVRIGLVAFERRQPVCRFILYFVAGKTLQINDKVRNEGKKEVNFSRHLHLYHE